MAANAVGAVAMSLFALPVAAGTVSIWAPIQAGSLHEGPLDMVIYYRPVEGQLLEVTGTYAPRSGGAASRFVMVLSDGDAVSFAMPGYREARYSFVRKGISVTATVEAPFSDALALDAVNGCVRGRSLAGPQSDQGRGEAWSSEGLHLLHWQPPSGRRAGGSIPARRIETSLASGGGSGRLAGQPRLRARTGSVLGCGTHA
ncbi:hypothetical protein [Paracoccus ravus]|uniref:hypothetical protein n=1 Tax=Paracoccus ravus TaxID=2447760 RepID=UPI001430D171|nr:hypothetical protein [Paracoccus ravus]